MKEAAPGVGSPSNGPSSQTTLRIDGPNSPRNLASGGTRALWQPKPAPASERMRPASDPAHSDEAECRRLQALFRRNPDSDGQSDRVRYEGYEVYWPDGEPMGVNVGRFCQQGCRLLGLGRRMQGKNEQLVELTIHPLSGLEAPLTRLPPGNRCRRFYLERQDGRGKIYFFNGSPTEMEFDAQDDDPRVLEWLGLRTMGDGEQFWFDLSAYSMT